MATHGSLGEYLAGQDDWPTYLERVEEYFVANDVGGEGSDAKKRAILLSCCGTTTYQVAKQLFAPTKLNTCTYKQVVEKLTGHFAPTPTAVIQRCKFNSRVRMPGESVSTYCAELRKLSEFCDFGDRLEDMLRDRLVCGISDQRMQQRLLSEEGLDFKKAFDLAIRMEAAQKDTKELQQNSIQPVNFLRDSRPKPSQRGTPSPCYRCGGKHHSSKCKFKEENCHFCGKKGHISKVCRSRLGGHRKPQQQKTQPTHNARFVEVKEPTDSADDPIYSTFQLSSPGTAPLVVTVNANSVDLKMEIDTGASVSVISEQMYWTVWSKEQRPVLQQSTAQLRTYSGELLCVLGSITVSVSYRDQQCDLPLLVARGVSDELPLLGRDWLRVLKLDWKAVHLVQGPSNSMDQQLQSILNEHSDVFRDELGLMQGVKVSLQVTADAKPIYQRSRPVPFALRSRVEAELDRLENCGVIEPVSYSEWAAPIVPVVKQDGSIRICGDFRVTINQVAQRDMYPLPKVEDLLSTLAGGNTFSKLDLSHAYQQIQLSEESRKLVTINTTKGLYQYTRLPFGISAAPSIFQRTMENLLKGIPQVVVYIDDILVTGKTDAEHLQHLKEVLARLKKAGMKLKESKCSFMMEKVTYLGHVISQEGIYPAAEKVRAVSEAPIPSNVTQLKSFLGLLNFYSRFLPNHSTKLAPLHKLLQKNTPWKWESEQQEAFEIAKASLSSSTCLTHYDPAKSLVVSCDASSYGVGAVLAHELTDGSTQPIAYASRSLSPAEKNYAQIDREGLAIIFAVVKFRQYLLGRKFTIKTDHKPLTQLFSPDRAVSPIASARIQRWSLILCGYDYTIEHKSWSLKR